MTDLHTHILPGMDDGSRSVEMSVDMLRAQAAQGVGTVVLTPHYYRERESSGHVLERRAQAMETLRAALDALPEEERAALPELRLAAEVAWVPNLIDCGRLRELCYPGTSAFLLELPMSPWYDGLFHQLFDLMNMTGLTPVIAHIDRYWRSQRPERMAELRSLGLPTQLSAEALLHFSTRGPALRELRQGTARLLMSDCHNLQSRRPNLREGMDVAGKKLGAAARDALIAETDALLRTYALPDGAEQ